MVQNMSCKIYMDHAATTEMLPQVRKAMEPYLMEEYGNASTSYEMGRRTREALEGAREQIAMLIKAKPEEIFFTSGGSESDNWVIKNVAAEKKEKGIFLGKCTMMDFVFAVFDFFFAPLIFQHGKTSCLYL